jgi:hypothetical protein
MSARGSAATFLALALEEYAIEIANQKPTLMIGIVFGVDMNSLDPVTAPREP